MGMDPGTAYLLSTLVSSGLGFAGGAMQGDGQELEGFDGKIAPQNLMEDFLPMLKGAFNDASEKAQRPVTLPSSYVQDLPTFTGGGLPFPIGVTGHDPALKNPDLLTITKDGIGGGGPRGGEVHRQVPLGGRQPDASAGMESPDAPDPIGGFNTPNDVPTDFRTFDTENLAGSSRSVARRGMPNANLMPTSDLDQGEAAAQLLLHALGG